MSHSIFKPIPAVFSNSPKVYISCPMTGYKDNNIPLIRKAEKFLIKRGYEVYSPSILEPAISAGKITIEEAMELYFDTIRTKVQRVYILGSWDEVSHSEGCKLELACAALANIPTLPLTV